MPSRERAHGVELSPLKVSQPSKNGGTISGPALLVFSHLRWHFVTQRPQHLLTRAARTRPVYFWEEPFLHEAATAPAHAQAGGSLEFLSDEHAPHVTVIRPHF